MQRWGGESQLSVGVDEWVSWTRNTYNGRVCVGC